MTLVELVVGFVLSIVVARMLHFPLVYGIGIVALLWMMVRGGGTGNVIGGITGAVRGTFGFFQRLVVGVTVFVGLMMLMDRFIGVSPFSVTQRFQVLGPMPWNWPSNIGLPMLIFVCSIFIMATIARRAANGDITRAGIIFVGSFIVIFAIMHEPRGTEAVRPKPVNGPATPLPGETQAWADYDKAKAESGRLPTYFCIAWQDAFGPRWPCGPVAPKSAKSTASATAVYPTAAIPTPRVVKIGQSKVLYRFGTDGCVTVTLRGNWSDYPKGGKISFTDLSTGTVVLYDEPGTATSSSLPPGDYRICKEDPSAWGVEIWQ